MGKVLLFGGLSRLGKPVIEQLLNNGDEVIAVRTSSNETVQSLEENIELLFGRNALFQSADTEWKEDSLEVQSVICLDSTTFISPEDHYVDAERVMKRIGQCLEACPNLSDIIVASHIEIYGQPLGEVNERTPVAPETNKGFHVDRIERGVIETLLQYKEKARGIRAVICRLPNIYTTNHSKKNESIFIDDVAKGICALLHTERTPGIEVVQLTSGQEFLTERGMTKYSFEKAKHLIDFSPNQNQ